MLKHKVTTREAVAARFAGEGACPLTLGGPPVESPGARFRIEAAPRNNQGDMRPYVFVTDKETGRQHELHWLNPGARVAFDHEGTTLLLRDEEFKAYLTFDLPSRLNMQTFPDSNRGR